MKRNKVGYKIAAIVVAVIAIIITVVVVFFSSLNKVKKADYYSLGKDQVPTIKLVVGERKISSVSSSISNGVTTKTYDYSSDSSYEDIESYVTYLVEKAGYRTATLAGAEGITHYGINSVEEGKIILIKADVNPFGYTIEIVKGVGGFDY